MINIERLIELVKKHEFLYDMAHKDYKSPRLKLATWEAIAKELNGTSKFMLYFQLLLISEYIYLSHAIT